MILAIEFWHWWAIAVALGVAEIFVSGFILLWMGIAAGVVGLLLLIAPDLNWKFQLLIFAVLSVAAMAAWHFYRLRHPVAATDHPTLNRRGQSLIGRSCTLDEPIVSGSGFARIDDTRWKIEGDDLPAGRRIIVTGVDGSILRIEPN